MSTSTAPTPPAPLPPSLHETGRCLIMGIVNVTPDSFSDGGQWFDTDVAIAHARHLLTQGADIVDIGGESTRPGADPVTPGEELARILPVVEALARDGATVSIDTFSAATAEAALAAGARIVNDVSGGLADPGMAGVVARTGAVYVLGHWRGTPETMNSLATYDDVVAEVCAELEERVAETLAAGVRREQIVLDPGLGFAKDADQNWRVLARLDALTLSATPSWWAPPASGSSPGSSRPRSPGSPSRATSRKYGNWPGNPDIFFPVY